LEEDEIKEIYLDREKRTTSTEHRMMKPLKKRKTRSRKRKTK